MKFGVCADLVHSNVEASLRLADNLAWTIQESLLRIHNTATYNTEYLAGSITLGIMHLWRMELNWCLGRSWKQKVLAGKQASQSEYSISPQKSKHWVERMDNEEKKGR